MTANKHALLVGVDCYSMLEDRYQLSGCVNDAKLIKSVLIEHFNFDPSRITELHDAQATRTAMLAAMTALQQRIARDDIVVFHFSGHGSRRTTPNPEKAGGKDNTIMPSDSGRHPHPNLDISDDEIYTWLSKLAEKTRYITLTFDCCHSGTITRDMFAGAARGAPEDTRSVEEMGLGTGATTMTAVPAVRGGGGGWLGHSAAYVVISGCRDHEVSNEFTREEGGELIRNGALTHYLTQALMKARPGTTYRDVFEIACQGVGTQFPNQHPQIEGQLDRQVLGVEDVEPMRFIAITDVEGDRVTMAGGAAHGLQRGSKWQVFPQGTKRAQDAAPLATLEVTSVGSLTSQARVLNGAADIILGSRCVEIPGSAGSRPLKVDVSCLAADHREQLRAALAANTLVALAKGPDDADVRAYCLAPRARSSAEDPAPQLGAVTEPSWVFVGLDGDLVMQPHPATDGSALPAMVRDLSTVARYRNALLLENPNSTIKADFNIYQQQADGAWTKANGGDSVYRSNDRIAFEVVNRMDVPIYVSLLNLCMDGEIFLLYPPNKDGERIEAGRTLTLGKADREIRLSMPASRPQLAEGVETLKAFITTEPTDFTWLTQDGAFDDDAGGMRKAVIQSSETDAPDWTAINRSYLLTR